MNFNHYYFPKIFHNPEYLQLRESAFNSGIGSLLSVENKLNPNLTFIGKFFDDSNKSLIVLNIDNNHQKDLVMIINCIFKDIEIPNAIHIKIHNEKITFYMDGCTYINTNANNVIFDIKTRATTFSHICCSELKRTENVGNRPLFIEAYLCSGSFIKIIDSTFYGTDEIVKAEGLFYLQGEVSVQFYNLNVSKFKTENDRGIVKIDNSLCT